MRLSCHTRRNHCTDTFRRLYSGTHTLWGKNECSSPDRQYIWISEKEIKQITKIFLAVKIHIFKVSLIYCQVNIIYHLLDILLPPFPSFTQELLVWKELKLLFDEVLCFGSAAVTEQSKNQCFVTSAVLKEVQTGKCAWTSSVRLEHWVAWKV